MLQKGFLIKQGNELKSPIVPLHSTLFFDEVGNLCFRSGKIGISRIIIAIDGQSTTSVTQTIVSSDVQNVTKSEVNSTFDKNNSIQNSNVEEKKVVDSIGTTVSTGSISKNLVSSVIINYSPSIQTKEKNNEKLIEPTKTEKTKIDSISFNIDAVNTNMKIEKARWDSIFADAHERQKTINLLREEAERKVRQDDCKSMKQAKKNTREKKKLERSHWKSLKSPSE